MKKLQLNKQTIANLNDDQQASIYGGGIKLDTDEVDGCASRVYCGPPISDGCTNISCACTFAACK
jgi:hypothetical protein